MQVIQYETSDYKTLDCPMQIAVTYGKKFEETTRWKVFQTFDQFVYLITPCDCLG